MTRHELKCHPQFWDGMKNGSKSFCVRRNDRKFFVDDVCKFRRYDPAFGYTSHEPIELRITYILAHEDFPIGLQRGYVVLGFGLHPMQDDLR